MLNINEYIYIYIYRGGEGGVYDTQGVVEEIFEVINMDYFKIYTYTYIRNSIYLYIHIYITFSI